MTITEDLKKQAAKSNWWKWGCVVIAMIGVVGMMAIGKKEDAYKIMDVAGELISVKVSDNNIEVLSATSPVSMTDVSGTSFE